MPYLHERRSYLIRKKRNTDYIHTSIETSLNDQIQFNKNLKEHYGVRDNSHLMETPGDEDDNKSQIKTVTSIIVMNKTESKFYSFS